MKAKDFYYRDLIFWEDLIYFGEAMRYAFGEEPRSNKDKERQQGWIDEVVSITTRKDMVGRELMENFKKQNAEFLTESPILAGLIDSYIEASKTDDPAILKKNYEAFKNMQKDLPFEQNKEAYIDAGCCISSSGDLEGRVFVEFPVSLYSGWDPSEKEYDDHRGGYLLPLEKHYLEETDVVRIAEMRPALLKKSSALKNAYDKVVAKQGPSNN